MNRAVIFDLDGTLADTREDIAASVNILLSRFHLPTLPIDQIVSYVGNGSRKLVERSLKGQSPDFIDRAFAEYNSCYLETVCIHSKLYPGVKDGLSTLKQNGWKLAVLSNKPDVIVQPLIRELGIADLFTIIQGGKPDFPLKPDPAGAQLILKQMDTLPEDSWAVGDNYTDLEMGRNAGMKRVFCSWGFGDPKSETWELKADSFSILTQHLIQTI